MLYRTSIYFSGFQSVVHGTLSSVYEVNAILIILNRYLPFYCDVFCVNGEKYWQQNYHLNQLPLPSNHCSTQRLLFFLNFLQN